MVLKIFTVYDSKADAFLPPFFAQATGVALRMFEESISDPQHQFAKHAGDYTLFELGSFDQATGNITTLKAHLNLGCAITFLNMTTTPQEALHGV